MGWTLPVVLTSWYITSSSWCVHENVTLSPDNICSPSGPTAMVKSVGASGLRWKSSGGVTSSIVVVTGSSDVNIEVFSTISSVYLSLMTSLVLSRK